MQLKYNETGREKDCLPRVGQWNMMNKVTAWTFFSSYKLYSPYYYEPDAHSRIGEQVEVGRQTIFYHLFDSYCPNSDRYCTSAISPHGCFYSNHASPCALHDTICDNIKLYNE